MRRRIKGGLPLGGLLAPAVERFLYEHRILGAVRPPPSGTLGTDGLEQRTLRVKERRTGARASEGGGLKEGCAYLEKRRQA